MSRGIQGRWVSSPFVGRGDRARRHSCRAGASLAWLPAAHRESRWWRGVDPAEDAVGRSGSPGHLQLRDEHPASAARAGGDKQVLSDEEAAALQADLAHRLDRDRRDGGAQADVSRSYNDAWMDPARMRLTADKRTSLIIDPPDGRIPPRVERSSPRRKKGTHRGGLVDASLQHRLPGELPRHGRRQPLHHPASQRRWRTPVSAGHLQQHGSDLPGAGLCRHLFRNDPFRAGHSGRWAACAAGQRREPGSAIRAAAGKATPWSSRRGTSFRETMSVAPVWSTGTRTRDVPDRRAVHTRRPRDDQLRGHAVGSGDVDAAVHHHGSVEQDE